MRAFGPAEVLAPSGEEVDAASEARRGVLIELVDRVGVGPRLMLFRAVERPRMLATGGVGEVEEERMFSGEVVPLAADDASASNSSSDGH